jgi:hypothetical protein
LYRAACRRPAHAAELATAHPFIGRMHTRVAQYGKH